MTAVTPDHPSLGPTRLHLGCGQRYLDGYLNIDFPPDQHTVQINSVADQHHNLLELRYPAGSIKEIRSHHVFEHFSRPVALALLATWNAWLEVEGILRIEVPDFTRTALSILNPLSSAEVRCVGLRHLFGSNEAPWAVHYDGWTKANFILAGEATGFRVDSIKRNHHKHTYNIEFFASKTCNFSDYPSPENRIQSFLARFLVDNSEGGLLEVWMKQFREQQARMMHS